MAMGLVFENSENTIIKITVKGTLRNIPAMPQILPQMASDNITTKGLKLSELLIKRGSRIFPTNI